MASGLTRRQNRKKRGRKKEEKAANARARKRDNSNDEQSCSSQNGSVKSRLDQMMSSCTCCSSIKGRIMRIEREFGDMLYRGHGFMQQQQLSGLARSTIMQAYSFCSDYFSITDEDSSTASTTERTPLSGESHEETYVSQDCIPQKQEMDRSSSSNSLQAIQLHLSPVPEHKIATSSIASLNANLKAPMSPLANSSDTVEETAKDSDDESTESEPNLVNETSTPEEVVDEEESDVVEPQFPQFPWEVPEVSRLRDYSKTTGELPYLSPASMARIAPVPKKTEYMQSLNAEEDTPLTESDITRLEQQSENDGKVQFFLRVPKSKKLRQTRQRQVDRTLSGLKTKSPKQIANLRRQNLSTGSDASDRTPKYVAPFPMPLSRDNSHDKSEITPNESSSVDGVSPHRDRERTVRRMSFVAGSKINRFDGSGPHHVSVSSADPSSDARESSVGQMISSEILNHRLSNGSKNHQRLRSGSASSRAEALSYGGKRRNFPPQKSASDADPGDVLARTGGRTMISRRGSFVAGSKIEHFNGRNRNFPSRVKEGLGDLSLEFDRSDRRNRTISSRSKEGLGELSLDNNGSKRRHRTVSTRSKEGRRVLSLENSGSSQIKRTLSAQSEESFGNLKLENGGSRQNSGSRRNSGASKRNSSASKRNSGSSRIRRTRSSQSHESFGNLGPETGGSRRGSLSMEIGVPRRAKRNSS
ncbi:unnamed protein product [Cylindrotheca closterium]|uniref:Uncharacterized protein n=1 Tax=Cylindrotheca closterium TaxID=2856 RepID=A0AAD2FLU5_9STRA|nr:unnamed protein product [Cylindrotheca closterium]